MKPGSHTSWLRGHSADLPNFGVHGAACGSGSASTWELVCICMHRQDSFALAPVRLGFCECVPMEKCWNRGWIDFRCPSMWSCQCSRNRALWLRMRCRESKKQADTVIGSLGICQYVSEWILLFCAQSKKPSQLRSLGHAGEMCLHPLRNVFWLWPDCSQVCRFVMADGVQLAAVAFQLST